MLNYLKSLLLHHNGDCRLLGITPSLSLFVEEIYGDDDLIAQHIMTMDGTMTRSVDEAAHSSSNFAPLALPPDAIRPLSVRHASRLNFSGPRHRGLRDQERISDVARALEVPTRLRLAQQIGIAMPHILGVAESRVLAETLLSPLDTYLVCRRLRIAFALAQPQRDPDGQWYDYDTVVLYAAHLYNPAVDDVEMPPEQVLAGLPGVPLRRPMDCMVSQKHLFIADGGDLTHPSQIHIWHIA